MKIIAAASLNLTSTSSSKPVVARKNGQSAANDDDSSDETTRASATPAFGNVLSAALNSAPQPRAVTQLVRDKSGSDDSPLTASLPANAFVEAKDNTTPGGAEPGEKLTIPPVPSPFQSSETDIKPIGSEQADRVAPAPTGARQVAPPVVKAPVARIIPSQPALKVTGNDDSTARPSADSLNPNLNPGPSGRDKGPETHGQGGLTVRNTTTLGTSGPNNLSSDLTRSDEKPDAIAVVATPLEEVPKLLPVKTTESKKEAPVASVVSGGAPTPVNHAPSGQTSPPAQVGSTLPTQPVVANVSGATAPANATATTGRVASTPAVSDQVAEAILGKASLVQRGGTTDIYLRLNPPELGAVNLHLRATGQTLTARVIVSGDAAQAAIENQLPQLRARLGESGITLGGFDVAQQRQDSQPQAPQPSLPENEPPVNLSQISHLTEVETKPSQPRGLLDVLV